MYEVEIKARAEHVDIRKKLVTMGATHIGIEHHLDTYYNSPWRDFSATDEALRIRSVNGKSILTYKGQKVDTISKTRPEYETEIDGDNARKILNALGFKESGIVNKQRDVFKFKQMIIALDHVDNLGDFIEVEKQAEEDIEKHRTEIFDFLKILNIQADDTLRTSYLEMIQEKNGN